MNLSGLRSRSERENEEKGVKVNGAETIQLD